MAPKGVVSGEERAEATLKKSSPTAMQMLTNIAPLGGLLKLRSGSRSADVSSFVFKLTCRYTSAVLVALSFLISSSNWLR